MRAILTISLISLILITNISAELIVSPNPIAISTNVGESKSYELFLENKNEFTISNFTFGNLTDLGFSFPEVELLENESKTIIFNITTSSSIHEVIESRISFKFPVDLPNEPTTHNININAYGIYPDYIIIRKGDTIVWTNNDDISHQLFSTEFDFIIEPDNTASYTFNNIRTIFYYDPKWYGWGEFEATIEVINSTSEELAHNPNYDIIWSVDLNSILNPTNISVENSQSEYEIEYNKFKKGLITIRNNGSELAELVELNANTDWISFEENNFNIEPGEQEWVEYTILPIIFETNSTDQTYNFEISIKASNSEEEKINISVFIPYHKVDPTLDSDQDFLKWLDQFYCPRHPNSYFCDPTAGQSGDGSTNYSDIEIPINISKISFYNLMRDVAQIRDSNARSDNELKILADKYGLTIPSILELLNQSLEIQEKTENREQGRWNIIWIIGGGIMIIVLALWVIGTINRKSFKEDLFEGAFKYRK